MIYVHVPFCKKFCTYCDFYSEIAEDGCFKAYADGVCAEIRQRAKEMDDDPKTLYFGGGTPSVLPLSVLTRILITLDEVGHGGPYREFTMEVNPEDIVEKGKGYVESLLSLGVNRLSIGVQSFDDGMLQWMNRRHDAARAKEAFRLAREAGAENISLDLIFGITHLEDAVWADTIDQAIALGPEHISCYQLTPPLRNLQFCQGRLRGGPQRRLLGTPSLCGNRPWSAFFPRKLPFLEQQSPPRMEVDEGNPLPRRHPRRNHHAGPPD